MLISVAMAVPHSHLRLSTLFVLAPSCLNLVDYVTCDPVDTAKNGYF